MKMKLTPELVDYLKKNNLDSFTLSIKKSRSCCSVYNQVVPSFGPPTKGMEPCKAYTTEDGITVYLSPQVEFTKDTLTFGISQLFKFYRITMDGILIASR